MCREASIIARFMEIAMSMDIDVTSRPYLAGKDTEAVIVAGPAIMGEASGTMDRSSNFWL